jgi:hypothetical protein
LPSHLAVVATSRFDELRHTEMVAMLAMGVGVP